ncbi:MULTISPECIES: cobyric acid synthase [Sulfurospirillum]|uniref:Cobyric acid synthase n=4 Tax=Sulfurospirillum TaxID=57665 RepID=A0A1Y0HMG2_9BACT|nr:MULTISPECIES: cobyric acid synthase [Sulfurospirillum]AHJ12806.1 cobyric acid synthase CbiP [Sulfurospirillum multivorans DSM 12446]AOO65285.1 cobyric acid synthase CbiP [Sulfurospirillum halorespirans DSM 13726]ARU48766.1 Cobyric acid synthase CbiP [Sulfurospirillum diekertiae]ASC93588.1 Cobyric acid synthase CbiP [Sulfurospirillum diekertiae]ATB69632.1 cobyric acid synthase CbiP [Sulfurospirillum diekertiae]
MKHKNLMVYGTGSDVGKSVIVAGLCRILKQDGVRVCPFKSQNMALNSYITKDGKEMGRAQVVQAEAAGLEPDVMMNPILLKPSTDRKAQVILHGKALRNMDAREYFTNRGAMKIEVMKAYNKIRENYDVSIIEGAGSPAEINLKVDDLVNTGMAEMADAPAVLVADIDKGGVFASIYGTIKLLEKHESARIKGVIINKFRGDVTLLEPGLRMIEEKINIPVLGVIPYIQLGIEEEDGFGDRHLEKKARGAIDIAVIVPKRISNFTDMDALLRHSDVTVRYVRKVHEIENPDVIILPGSKNTIEDMLDLQQRGMAEAVIKHAKNGVIIFGICGGFQMLGQKIQDEFGIESSIQEITGLGLLDIETTMLKEKTTTQFEGLLSCNTGFLQGMTKCRIKGYEIHQGITYGNEANLFEGTEALLGAIRDNVIGTYIHGVFDNSDFTTEFLNRIREKKGITKVDEVFDYDAYKQGEYDKLALLLRENLDMRAIYNIIGVE